VTVEFVVVVQAEFILSSNATNRQRTNTRAYHKYISCNFLIFL